MINENNPAYRCKTQKGSGESEYKVKCSLLREEKCNSDEECGEQEKCRNNICTSFSGYQKKILFILQYDNIHTISFITNSIIYIIFKYL